MTKKIKNYEPDLPAHIQQEIDNHFTQQEELIVDKVVDSMNSGRGALAHHFNDRSIAPDCFQKEIAAALLFKKEEIIGYRNASIRLPIKDYANIKALSMAISTPTSSLIRSLFQASLKEALTIFRYESTPEKWAEFESAFESTYESLLAEIEAEV